MEAFWFVWLRFRQAYDSAYDSGFWFSQRHRRSYDSAYDSDSESVVNANQSSVILLQIVMLSLGNDLVKNHESLSVTSES